MTAQSGPEKVFRQVHPHHWNGENPNSVAFSPTPKDQDQLSVDDAALVSAEKSWTHFTNNLGFKSAGTWAITHAEIVDSGDLSLRSAPVADQADPAKNNLAHCLIDFSQITSKRAKRRCAQKLALLASARGRQFPPA